MSDSGDERGGIPLLETLFDSDAPSPLAKRKRSEDDDGTQEPQQSKRAAKRKKSKSKKPKDVDDDALDLSLGVNHGLAYMDNHLLSDHLAQRTKRFQPDLSVVEMDETHIPSQAILDTTDWTKPRVAENLPTYLEHYCGQRRKKRGHRMKDAPPDKGSPHTIVVAGGGQRAADLTRALAPFRTQHASVTKLFAKHIKMAEAIETVKRAHMSIGVGTPRRIIDLLDNGCLSTRHLERIVIDASFIDQKKRGVLDMKETHVPLVQLLSRAQLKEHYGEDKDRVELLFY